VAKKRLHADTTVPHVPPSEYREGPDAARRFETAMRRMIRVSKEDLQRREEDFRKSRRPKHRK